MAAIGMGAGMGMAGDQAGAGARIGVAILTVLVTNTAVHIITVSTSKGAELLRLPWIMRL